MRAVETTLPGVLLVEPAVFRDPRGFFLETYHREKYRKAGIDVEFVQDNHSRSAKGTLRGLHAQWKNPQGKLVRAVEGEIFDVAVDIRPESPHYTRWVAVTLSADNFRQLWVPPGFAHGFCVLSDVADVTYKCSTYYDAAVERGFHYADPDVAIAWPDDLALLVSDRDASAPRLAEIAADLPF